MEEQQQGLITTSLQAKSYIDRCLDTYEHGGKDQVREALRLSVLSHRQAQLSGSTGDSLWLLLHALISMHLYQPKLPQTDFFAVFNQLIEPSQIDENQSEEPKASSSRDLSPTNTNATELGSSAVFANVILDVIWAIDTEIDARKEFATSIGSTTLLGKDEDTSGTNSNIDERVKTAKLSLTDLIRNLLSNGSLSRKAVAERLETGLLAQIGLVNDETGFNRKYVRLNTANLYKQQKFNLLREENEGYSGLINELIGGMGLPIRGERVPESSEHRVVEQESVEERNMRARRVMNNISALIGFFDLDPNRVLDIVLDVFSTNVIHHWPFFLALLRVSPWSKGKGKATKKSTSSTTNGMDVDVSPDDKFGPVDVNVKEDQGHDVCAQVLGFKFGYYQQADVTDKVPEELYSMAAILIREGHIRFVDLYSHLSPDEKGMAALHEKYKQSMSDKVMSAKGNALSMAAPLTEEGAGLGGSDAGGKKDKDGKPIADAKSEPPNQILGLLKALLGIGLLKYSIFILGRYPWLCGAYPQVADLYSRLLNVIIEPAYSTISLSTQVPVVSNPSIAVRKMRYDTKRQELVEVPLPQLRVTSLAPEPLPTLTSHFVYFYPL